MGDLLRKLQYIHTLDYFSITKNLPMKFFTLYRKLKISYTLCFEL